MSLTIAEIKKLLSGRAAGIWVEGPDLLGQKEARPYVLLREPNFARPIQCLGRTSTPQGGSDEHPHTSHEVDHSPRCFIDLDGAIVLRPRNIRAAQMTDVGCDEPDDELMARLYWRYVP
jgi:hypothetical protein